MVVILAGFNLLKKSIGDPYIYIMNVAIGIENVMMTIIILSSTVIYMVNDKYLNSKQYQRRIALHTAGTWHTIVCPLQIQITFSCLYMYIITPSEMDQTCPWGMILNFVFEIWNNLN